jgi:hypothetical protein
VTGRVPPQIWSVEPNPSPPNKEVVVDGTTGSCNPSGALTLRTRQGPDIPIAVTGGENGNFTTPFTIPPGIYPGTYQLELNVRCDGQAQRTEAKLTLTNRPPKAVDHSITTTENKSVVIGITAGGGDPDGDDGYQTTLLVTPPRRGTAEVQSDNQVVYTPAPGFIGRDRFRYSLCDVIDADGTGACGAASVTVTVVREESTTSSTEESTTSSTEQSTTPAHLLVRPAEASILAGASQPHTAEAITQDGSSLGDVTAKTVFSISPSGACQGSRCTPATTGEHLITATLTQRGRAALNASAVLRVLPRKPSISRVTPRFTFPGMGVEVTGNTGSCTRVGVLTFHGITADVSVNVTADQQGNFVARFTVPKGTFPRIYKVELIVDCSGQLQRAEGELSVLNIAPTPVDDRASTLLDTPVTIEVTANDRNPDPDTGYPTLVLVSSQPTHGTAEVQPDNRIRYLPAKGFFGQDRGCPASRGTSVAARRVIRRHPPWSV